MNKQRFLLVPALAAAAVLALAGCNRQDDRTVGEKVDSTMAKVEQKTDAAVADMKAGSDTAKTEAGQAMDTAGAKMKDATITTTVNAELVRDKTLSATKIDVDTTDGRVALTGSAPDSAAKDRATKLAQAVDGVKSVDNQLTVAK